jgi:hypothetical protein
LRRRAVVEGQVEILRPELDALGRLVARGGGGGADDEGRDDESEGHKRICGLERDTGRGYSCDIETPI